MMAQLKPNQRRGFGLLEVMLTIALITTITGMSIPLYRSFQTHNDIDIAAGTIAQTLRRAQVLSQSVEADSTWGVKVGSGQITIFKGADFAGRDNSFDELYDISNGVFHSGVDEIVYTKLVGAPSVAGDVTLTSPDNEQKTISINSKGLVSY